MPHNFKLTGDYYVSKYGSDSNNGLTPDTPKRTVQAGLNLITTNNKTLVIGAGTYREVISRNLSSLSGTIISGDGTVVMQGYEGVFFSLQAVNTVTTINNIIFRGYSSILLATSSGTVASTIANFINCLITCPLKTFIPQQGFNTFNPSFDTTVFVDNLNYSVSGYSTSFSTITNSIIINSYFSTQTINNSYVNAASIVTIASSANYNNIQGAIIRNAATTVTTGTYQDFNGKYYNLSIVGNNTSVDAGTVGNPFYRADTSGRPFSFTNHRILYSTFNVNSISADPLFNNILKQDFTLQPNSPHLYRASDGINNIGGTQLATRVASTSASLSGGSASVTSLNLQSSDYVVTSPATSGFVVSAPILVNATPKVLKVINYNGLLAFNKDNSGGSVLNINVPDCLTYTAASAQNGANPDRLTYYMRWTTGASQPTVDADWNNGGLVTAGNYSLFEWNTKPSLDYGGLGNGEQNFNTGHTPTYINATYIQLKVVLRNDYLI